jgi:Helix-hairpin-helix motif
LSTINRQLSCGFFRSGFKWGVATLGTVHEHLIPIGVPQESKMQYRSGGRRALEIAAICLLGVLALTLVGCTDHGKPNDQEIRQKSAEATRQVRKDTKKLAANAKVAAANAVEGVNAAAQGVKEGMKGDTSGNTGDRVDINSASTVRIAMLPGISISKAHEIVNGRPYRDAHSLVTRGLLTQEQYDRISSKITAK